MYRKRVYTYEVRGTLAVTLHPATMRLEAQQEDKNVTAHSLVRGCGSWTACKGVRD